MSKALRGVLFAVLLAFSSIGFAQDTTDSISPEAGAATSGAMLSEATQVSQAAKDAGQPVQSATWMIAAANPLAVEAGASVLRADGTAADAMVAAQAVLGLVEPQSSGLGGGAFLVWYDAGTGDVTTLDGRETAPLAATPRLFQTSEGESLGFWDAAVGGRSVGTPGTPALMEEAHRRWGRSNWVGLFNDAIGLAEDGFAVSARLAELVAGDAERLSTHSATADFFSARLAARPSQVSGGRCDQFAMPCANVRSNDRPTARKKLCGPHSALIL